MEDVAVCYCVHCNYFSLWNKGKMVYPDFAGIEPPNEDLNNDIKNDYEEAGSILQNRLEGRLLYYAYVFKNFVWNLARKVKT